MRFFSRAVLLSLPLVASCVGGSAPKVAPRGTLSPHADVPPWKEDGPFEVVAVTPTGAVQGDVELSVTFSRPLRALGGAAPPPPVRLTPAIEGEWQWIGSRAARFAPKSRIPRGTEITIEIPKGIRALDGSVLEKEWKGTLTTAAPRVHTTPRDGAEGLPRDTKIFLAFNQPVALEEVTRRTKLVGPNGDVPVSFSIDDKQSDTFVVTPKAPLAPNARFEVVVDGALRGVEGPREMGKESRSALHTYGPLSAEVACNRDDRQRCRPRGYVEVSFTNAVRLRDAREAIRVEPPIPLRWHGGRPDQTTRSVTLDADFRAGTAYTIFVGTKNAKGQALVDEFGQPIGHEQRLEIAIGDHDPAVEVGFRGTYLEPRLLADVPVYSTNVTGLTLDAARVSLAEALALEAGQKGIADAILGKPGAFHLEPPGAGKNRLGKSLVPIPKLVGPTQRGAVLFRTRFQRGTHKPTEQVLVQVTDLALTAKVVSGAAHVWVTRLSDGKPVRGAKVSVADAEGKETEAVVADDAGFAKVSLAKPPSRDAVTALVARDGDDVAWRRADATLESWQTGAAACPTCAEGRALVFTDRGLYRPGDKAQVKGILRDTDARGLVVPSGRTLDVKMKGPEGDVVSTFQVTLSASGAFAKEVQIPDTGKLGRWELELKEGDRPWGESSFDVAEFRPTELEVSAELDKRDYVRGDAIRCDAKGKYLFGAPMGGAGVRMTLERSRASFQPPGLPDHSVSDDTWLSARRESFPFHTTLAKREDKLDGRGTASLASKADAPQIGPETVSCEADVTDLSRQSLAGAAQAFVHPGEVYLAVRAGTDGFVDAGSPVPAQVLAVDPQGKKRAGVPVKLELFRRSWKVTYLDAGGGRHHAEWVAVDTSVGSCQVTSAVEGPASCGLRTKEGGYHVLRATALDARKNPLASSVGVYVLGGGSPSWPDSDDLRVELVPDKKSYQVGDVAKILVKSPFPEAEAWITVEREGVTESERRTLTGGSPTIEVKITDAHLPNAFVSVHLVRGRTKAPPAGAKLADVGAPAYRVGVVPIVVDHASRRLAVTVTPDRTEHLPGEKVAVTVDVKDKSGKPADAEVTLYAVDEGVLSLAGYRTPDPVAVFFAPRPLRVETLETRDALAKVARAPGFLGPGLDKGLDGGGGGLAVRKDFRQTAVFLPALRTGDGGKATATFQLPDSLTSFRVMAVASSGVDRFGSGDARVTTSKPLMARPALPRFLRAGDTFEASVLVTSKGTSAGPVSVALAQEGLVATGPTKAEVSVGEGETKEVRFALEARTVGRAKLRFSADGSASRDAVEVTRDVTAPARLETAAVFGNTDDAAGEALGDLSAARTDVGGLRVTLAPTAVAALAGGLDQLVEYPYGCTEQLTSRLVPLLPLRDLAKSLGATLPPDVDQALAKTVSKVQQNQQPDGGFGLWPESTDSSSWLTAYALWGLVTARDHGIPIRPAALDAAKAFLKKRLAHDVAHDPVSATFVVDTLAQAGVPEPGAVTQLFEARAHLGTSSKAMLLAAAVASHSPKELRETLAREIVQEIRLDGPHARVVARQADWRVLDSDARASALVLRGLLRETPKHPLVPKLASGLVAARRGGRWRTTQETAWALLALAEYRRVVEGDAPEMDARYFLGQARLGQTRFEGQRPSPFAHETPMASLASAGGSVLAFEKHGRGMLFYEARLRFAPKEPPSRAVDQGFWVEKSLVPVTPETLATALGAPAAGVTQKIPAGQLVLVTLTVVAPSPREYVVLDDPLPAGLEAVDTHLRGASALLRVSPGETDDEDEDRRFDVPLTRRELRDDRALFFVDDLPAGTHRYRYLARATTIGRFSLPSTRIEEMYVPETFGETPASVVEVVP